jgi:hypothetical protein
MLPLLGPEIRRGQNRGDFKFDQVIPAADPSVQQLPVGCFHNLETARARHIDPTRVVGEAVREHPATVIEPLPDGLWVGVFEALDDHEEHDAAASQFPLSLDGFFCRAVCFSSAFIHSGGRPVRFAPTLSMALIALSISSFWERSSLMILLMFIWHSPVSCLQLSQE